MRLMQQQLHVWEVGRQQQLLVAKEVQNVTEHAAVTVDEVVLLQSVQHDWNRPVEHLTQPRLRVAADESQ